MRPPAYLEMLWGPFSRDTCVVTLGVASLSRAGAANSLSVYNRQPTVYNRRVGLVVIFLIVTYLDDPAGFLAAGVEFMT